MQAGDLRDRISFHMREAVGDGAGNTVGAFKAEPEFTVYANIRPRLGGEQVQAGRLAGVNSVNITVRQSPATRRIDTTWMVRDANSGVEHAIRSIIDPNQGNMQRGAWLELLCEEGVAA